MEEDTIRDVHGTYFRLGGKFHKELLDKGFVDINGNITKKGFDYQNSWIRFVYPDGRVTWFKKYSDEYNKFVNDNPSSGIEYAVPYTRSQYLESVYTTEECEEKWVKFTNGDGWVSWVVVDSQEWLKLIRDYPEIKSHKRFTDEEKNRFRR